MIRWYRVTLKRCYSATISYPGEKKYNIQVRHNGTLKQCNSVTVLQWYSVTVLQCYSVTVLQYHIQVRHSEMSASPKVGGWDWGLEAYP